MSITLKKARRTLIATAVLWAMGVGVAGANENIIRGPVVSTTGEGKKITVTIDQVGTNNWLSKDGTTSLGASNLAVVDGSSGDVTLDIIQVGKNSVANKIGLAAYTSGDTSISVKQGAIGTRAARLNATTPPSRTGFTERENNQTYITLGNSGQRAGASTVMVNQQSNSNTATLNLGNSAGAFTGTVQVAQFGGDSNWAKVTINGQTTDKTFRIAQNGSNNSLDLTATNVGGTGVDLNFGGVDLDTLANDVPDTGGSTVDHNNARTFDLTDVNFHIEARGGIHLGSIAQFDMRFAGSYNDIQIDLETASNLSKIKAVTFGGGGTGLGTTQKLAVYGASSAKITLDTLTVGTNNLIVNAPAGGIISLKNLIFEGDGTFSSTAGGTIDVSEGKITSATVLQSGAAHTATLTGTANKAASWDVAQSGTMGIQTIDVTNAVNGARYYLRQSGEGAHSMKFTNSAATTVDIIQSGNTAQVVDQASFSAAGGGTVTIIQTGPIN